MPSLPCSPQTSAPPGREPRGARRGWLPSLLAPVCPTCVSPGEQSWWGGDGLAEATLIPAGCRAGIRLLEEAFAAGELLGWVPGVDLGLLGIQPFPELRGMSWVGAQAPLGWILMGTARGGEAPREYSGIQATWPDREHSGM